MQYGLQIMNSESKIAISSDDAPLIIAEKYTLSQSGGPFDWSAGPYIPGPPYSISFDTEAAGGGNPLYSFDLPGGLTLIPGMFLGFKAPVGKSIFVRNIYNPGSRFIGTNATTIDMIVAQPLVSFTSYAQNWGMALYDAAGQPIYHSGARVMRVLKKIDESGTFVTENFSPYFFFSGNYFYWTDGTANKFLYTCGVRRLSEETFDRRVLSTVGVQLVNDTNWEPDPLGNGFIGLVNDDLF